MVGIKKLLLSPIRNKRGVGGDTDEVTVGATAMNMGITAVVLAALVGGYILYTEGSKVIVDVNTKAIQQENDSILSE